jgi:predicted N-acetyltransferase YhbS
MSEPVIRPMLESDLDAADRVHRIAFGTRFGLPDPSKFRGDAQIVRPRWAIEPDATIVAQIDGTIVGGACAMGWGSVFIVGPIFVHPDQAGRGLAHLLVRELIARADASGASLTGLFTFPESATHLRLYEGFDFVPQALTPILSKAPEARAQRVHLLFSKLTAVEQESTLRQLRQLTELTFPGLDLTREVRAVARLGLGETVLLGAPNDVRGFILDRAAKAAIRSSSSSPRCVRTLPAISAICLTLAKDLPLGSARRALLLARIRPALVPIGSCASAAFVPV